MDENWLVLKSENKYSFWNCHSQETISTSVENFTTLGRQHVLLNTYSYSNDYAILTTDNNPLPWRVIRGNSAVNLTNVTPDMQRFGYSFRKMAIDHRVLLVYHRSKYTASLMLIIFEDLDLFENSGKNCLKI